MNSLGDLPEDTVIHFKFPTSAFSTGLPLDLLGSPVISIYKDDNLTESVAGVTLTVAFDGTLGFQHCEVDMSADAFYSVNSFYQAVITLGTVEGSTVKGKVVADWSVELANGAIALAKAGVELSAAAIGLIWDEILTGGTHNITNSAGRRLRELGAAVLTTGTASAGTLNSLTASTAIAYTNQFVGSRLVIVGGVGAPAEFIIVATATGTDIITFAPAANAVLDNTSEYEVGPGLVHSETSNQGHIANAVIIDTNIGNAGTIPKFNGTAENPSLTIADATTIAAAIVPVQSKHFTLRKGSSIVLAQAYSAFIFNGLGGAIALGGRDVSLCTFISNTLTGIGIGAGRVFLRNCLLDGVSLNDCSANECALTGTFTATDAGSYTFNNCGSQNLITPAVIDMGAAVGNTDINLNNWSGPLTIENLGATGTDEIYISGRGSVTLAASCVGGTITLAGAFTFVNNGSGITVNRDDALDDGTADFDRTTDSQQAIRDRGDAAWSGGGGGGATIPKNQAFDDFQFTMVLSSNGRTAATGKTVTGEMAIDGAAYVAINGTIAEIGSGLYQVDLTADDTNGDVITYKFSATLSDDTNITILTSV